MIKKLTAVLFLATALAACTQSNSSKQSAGNGAKTGVVDSANAPVMKFETESHDFGKIKQGDKVTYEFKYKNEGKSPLIITDAYATCGCTTPEVSKEPIQPGAQGNVKVTFDSAGKNGLQDKLITVVANTLPAENRVHLTGEVLTAAKPTEKK